MTHWLVREWMNAVTFALFLSLAHRFYRSRLLSPVGTPRRKAATALLVLSMGEALRSGWAWIALASQNKGWPIFQTVQDLYPLIILAGSLILCGALCCIRVFSAPDDWVAWWTAIVLAIAFLAATILM